ncbi:hypothetical protein [Streptomyces sp.]|uniref:hypothetical protein n=1 Tax=Streptomyces sp. TaxID=1931 RepID=UPI002F93A416
MTDPDFQPAIDDAINELARRLRPWAVGMADPHMFAATWIADMRAEGWRVPLRPAPKPYKPTPEVAAATARRGAELARRELAAREALNREDT